MAKYTSEEKLQAVLRYIEGKESSHEIARLIGTDHKAILNWVKQYEYNGVEAFIKRYTNYSAQFKLDVLNYMIENGTSLLETAAIFNIATPSTLRFWKNNLKQKDSMPFNQRKRASIHEKETNKQPKQAPVEGSPEALQAEINRLRMENEYLKS